MSLCCDETHEHGVTCGVSAVPHGYYTDAIGEDITVQGEIAALQQKKEVGHVSGQPAAEATNVRGPASVPLLGHKLG
eukprot:10217033-Heterocapsa_arctica.AAC.1